VFSTPRSLKRAVISGAICVLSLLAGIPIVQAGDDKVTLETIRAALDKYSSSVQALEGKYRWSRRPADGAKSPTGVMSMNDQRGERDFRIDLSKGRLRTDDRESFSLQGLNGEPVPMGTHRLNVNDRGLNWSLRFTNPQCPVETDVPLDFPHQLTSSHSSPESKFVPWKLAGLHMLGSQESLLSRLMRSPDLKLLGQQEIDGVSCWHVTAKPGRFGSALSNEGGIEAWFDPTHAFLPRRIQVTRIVGKELRKEQVMTVLAFKTFPDSRQKSLRWFPARAVVQTSIETIEEFEVVDLSFNPEFEDEAFRIDADSLPAGVRVDSVPLAMPGAMPQGPSRSFTGGREDLWKDREALLAVQEEAIRKILAIPRVSSGTPNAPVARTPPASSVGSELLAWIEDRLWWPAIVIAAAVIAPVILFFRFRARRVVAQKSEPPA